jgi:hypothetical protein
MLQAPRITLTVRRNGWYASLPGKLPVGPYRSAGRAVHAVTRNVHM